MKKIVAFLLLINTAYAQTTAPAKAPVVPFPKDANGKIVYTEEVKADAVTKADLITRAEDWLLKTYKLPTDSVITNDKTTGKIVIKSRLNVTQVYFQKAQDAGNVRYTINILISEGKFSYTIDGFIHEKGGEVPSLGYVGRPYSEIKDLGVYKEDFRDIQKQVDAKTLQLIKSLKEAMSIVPKEKK